MNKYSLYDLSHELALINDELVTAEGEITPELETRLDALTVPFEAKVEGIVKMRRSVEARRDAVAREKARLDEREKMFEAAAERLKSYIKSCMERAGKKRIETDIATVWIQNNNPSVEILNKESVPAQYTTTETVVKIDAPQILKDLKAKKEVPGVRLVTDKTHLRIK